MLKLYKYSGAGNDFVVIDGRGVEGDILEEFRSSETISGLCDRNIGLGLEGRGRRGADGLMILREGKNGEYDFEMEYYNSDGSGGMMCGNGGRCIAAFADHLGIEPKNGGEYIFKAPDGIHKAEILERVSSDRSVVRLKMIDAFGLRELLGGYFLNTGTRHFVLFVEDVESVDVEKDGAALRHNELFAPEGANINFVSRTAQKGVLKIRTFEKGVEAETLACGTGVVAAAIASWKHGETPQSRNEGTLSYTMQARKDALSVDFTPCTETTPNGIVAKEVFLTGPAERE